MESFKTLNGVGAPLPLANVDTDRIIPKQFLKIVQRTGLGDALFHEIRFTDTGDEDPSFILNQEGYRDAQVLLAGDNFGCGSSREHAVWALMDYGVKCVIATSFSDIFAGNAVKNGLLAAVVSPQDMAYLFSLTAPGAPFRVDLESQTIAPPNGRSVSFEIDAFAKSRLLAGLDEIGLTLQHDADIAAYEARRAEDDITFIPRPLADTPSSGA